MTEQTKNVAGFGEIICDWDDGRREIIPFKNKILDGGREAMSRSLANQFGGIYRYWVRNMVFGSGGTAGGVTRYVDSFRTGLFGPVVISKPVISTINPSLTSQAIFTSVLLYGDANGQTVNEMGLQLDNESYFSLTTFDDIVKQSNIQLTFNWKVQWV